MIDDVLELWMIMSAIKRDDAMSSLLVAEEAMQRHVISVVEQTDDLEERRRRLTRLFRLSGLTADEWSELMPMEAQFE